MRRAVCSSAHRARERVQFSRLYCLMKPRLAFTLSRQAAARALSIDTLAPAHLEMTLATFDGDWDWAGSEATFRRAVALDPSNALAHVRYSWLLMVLRREDAAFGEARTGHALALSSRLVATSRAQTLFLGGRYDDAIEICGAVAAMTLSTCSPYSFPVCATSPSWSIGVRLAISNRLPR